MNRFCIAVCIVSVTLLAGTSMTLLNLLVGPQAPWQPRVLFVPDKSSPDWQRAERGARDAARAFRIQLDVQTATSDIREISSDRRDSILHTVQVADYDGVAFTANSAGPDVEWINDVSIRTKLVTLGRSDPESNRLCHVGCNAANEGALAARLARKQTLTQGRVVLLSTKIAEGAAQSRFVERLAGFRETWLSESTSSEPKDLIEIVVDTEKLAGVTERLSTALATPNLVCIVAFDTASAESALRFLGSRSASRRVPLVAFDPNEPIFEAIDDGRVYAAIYNDPYRCSYRAIERLGRYCRASATELPKAGRGRDVLDSTVVRKSNLAEFRGRSAPDRQLRISRDTERSTDLCDPRGALEHHRGRASSGGAAEVSATAASKK